MIHQSDVLIYHNPHCSKSRATLELLRQNGFEPTVVEYLKNPPDRQTLAHILTLLGADPRDLMRKREAAYAANSLQDPSLSRDQLIAAMVANPILIERPIVLANSKAVVGRPPENILKIL
ncbi:MAG: arsenate reductase (glutaredoxin) [Gammaproteobacteria bacterium]